MFKKFAAAAAATALVFSATAAQAGSASALSLSQNRAATTVKKDNKQVGPINPLFFVLGIVGVVAILEVTGAINIFGDDSPDSP